MDESIQATWTWKIKWSNNKKMQIISSWLSVPKTLRLAIQRLTAMTRGLQEAFKEMAPILQEQLAPQSFHSHPPLLHYFCWAWERLMWCFKDQIILEEVLRTALMETDIADPDPIMPNLLLMGGWNDSLPHVVYGSSKLLISRRRRHGQIITDHFRSHFIHQ